MQEQGASQEETTSLEEAAGSPWEEEGTEVSVAKDRDTALRFQTVGSRTRNTNYPVRVLPPPTKCVFIRYRNGAGQTF